MKPTDLANNVLEAASTVVTMGVIDPRYGAGALYLAAAGLCYWAFRVARIGAVVAVNFPHADRRASQRRHAYRASVAFWMALVLLLVFMAVNRFVDAQAWLTEYGRDLALRQGWYEQRWDIQGPIVGTAIAVGAMTLSIFLLLTRELLRRHLIAFFGAMVLVFLLFSRALSFHHLDVLLDRSIAGVRMRWIAELFSLACVAGGAVRFGWWWNARALRLLNPRAASPDTSRI